MKTQVLFLTIIFLLSNIYAQKINYDYIQDVRGENIFEYPIHPGLPNFKFVLIGDSSYNSIVEIIIYKTTDTIRVQDILIDDGIESPVKGTEYFQTCDLNFDGYKDIMLLEYWGVTGNRIYKAWLFNPKKGQFESNAFLSNIYSPEFDYKKKEFTMFEKGGYGEFSYTTYKYIKKKFLLIRKKEQYWDKKKENHFEDIYERKNGKMVIKSHKKIEE